MKLIRLIAIIAVAVSFIACNDSQTGIQKFETPSGQKELAGLIAIHDEKPEHVGDGFEQDTVQYREKGDRKQRKDQQPAQNQDWDKKIIKTAVLNVEVEDYDQFYASVRESMKQLGGYIAQEEQLQTDYKIQNSLVIKIPVDRFDEALVLASANTKSIHEKKINSQDVTTEVVDTKSRLEAKKHVRERYMDLLRQAKNMEEILRVQSEINSIQVEIESAAGRINYLGHSAVFSTIHLTYYQVVNADAKDNETPSFAKKLSLAFGSGWSWFGDLFIGLVSIWPLYLLIFTCVIIYKRSRFHKIKAIKTSNS